MTKTKIEVHGKVYESMTAFAKALGMKSSCFKEQRRRGNSFENIKRKAEAIQNRVKIVGDIVIINIYDKSYNITDQTIVDVEDFDLVKDYAWSQIGSRQVQCCMKSIHVSLPRWILGIHGKNQDDNVFHIDRNLLNNRRSNLKIVGKAQCQHAQVIPKNNTSGFKGVTFHKSSQKWMARIHLDNKPIYLGLHPTREDAAVVYNEKALELFGEFANLNKL